MERYTLTDGVDEYLDLRGVDKKKYFDRYLRCAGAAWFKIFKHTLWTAKNVWQPIKAGNPFNYVDVPADAELVFSVSTTDKCDNVIPLYYNPSVNVLPKPTEKACGCDKEGCGGVCEDINTTSMTTKIMFTDGGIDYYEKTWLKYCKNGDVIEYKETPYKSYNDTTGDNTGDYNIDYNDDSNIAGGFVFANYTIKTTVSNRILVTLKTRPCGCPDDSEENQILLQENCGCFLNNFCKNRIKHCHRFLNTVNDECRGEITFSNDETKIFVRNRRPNTDYLLVNYQTNNKPDGQTYVPELAKETLWKGIDYYSKIFNNSFTPGEKKFSEYEFNDARNCLVMDLYRVDLQVLSTLSNSPVKW